MYKTRKFARKVSFNQILLFFLMILLKYKYEEFNNYIVFVDGIGQ